MDDPKPILSYALPAATPAAVVDRTVFTFASPSRGQLVGDILAVIICFSAAAISAALSFLDSPMGDGQLLGISFAILFLAVGSWRIPKIRRGFRYGDLPVEFRIADGMLVIQAPVQWGEHPRTINFADLKRISITHDAKPLFAMQVFNIRVKRHGWLPTCVVKVTAQQSDIVAREVVDLCKALEAAADTSIETLTADES